MREVEDEYRRVSRELTSEEWAKRLRFHWLVDDHIRLAYAVQ